MSGIKKRAACLAACFLALIFVFAQPLCAQAASVSAPLPEVRTLTYSEKETCKKELFLSARFADEAGTLLPYRYYLPALDDWLFSQRRAHTQNKLVYVIAGAAAAVLAAGIALSVFAVRSKRAKCASGG